MKLYYFLGYLLRPLGLVGLYAYSYLTQTVRVRAVVHNEKGEVLLVQTWLGGGKWGLPGGGVNHGEKFEVAALRELEEETGVVALTETIQPLCTLRSAGHNEIALALQAASKSLPSQPPNKYEIKEAAWFPLNALPPLESLAARIIDKVATER